MCIRDRYYSIPYGAETAITGHWEQGPGIDLFNRVRQVLGEKEVIAEDLGYVTDVYKRQGHCRRLHKKSSQWKGRYLLKLTLAKDRIFSHYFITLDQICLLIQVIRRTDMYRDNAYFVTDLYSIMELLIKMCIRDSVSCFCNIVQPLALNIINLHCIFKCILYIF